MNTLFRANEPDVTYEFFDTEVLAINLRNGNYYSLLESAVPIWLLLMQGLDDTEIGRTLARSCAADEATVTAAVRNFIGELEKENLIVRQTAALEAKNAPSPVTLPDKFVSPVLDRYTDMQQLLLMDPIHEVDVTGWPNGAQTKAGS
jgi:hypothetical protein